MQILHLQEQMKLMQAQHMQNKTNISQKESIRSNQSTDICNKILSEEKKEKANGETKSKLELLQSRNEYLENELERLREAVKAITGEKEKLPNVQLQSYNSTNVDQPKIPLTSFLSLSQENSKVENDNLSQEEYDLKKIYESLDQYFRKATPLAEEYDPQIHGTIRDITFPSSTPYINKITQNNDNNQALQDALIRSQQQNINCNVSTLLENKESLKKEVAMPLNIPDAFTRNDLQLILEPNCSLNKDSKQDSKNSKKNIIQNAESSSTNPKNDGYDETSSSVEAINSMRSTIEAMKLEMNEKDEKISHLEKIMQRAHNVLQIPQTDALIKDENHCPNHSSDKANPNLLHWLSGNSRSPLVSHLSVRRSGRKSLSMELDSSTSTLLTEISVCPPQEQNLSLTDCNSGSKNNQEVVHYAAKSNVEFLKNYLNGNGSESISSAILQND